MRTCLVFRNCAEKCQIVLELFKNFDGLYASTMRDDGPHCNHVLGLRSPYEHCQIFIQGHYELTKFSPPDRLNANASRKLLTLFVRNYCLFFLFIVLRNVLLIDWRRLGKLAQEGEGF